MYFLFFLGLSVPSDSLRTFFLPLLFLNYDHPGVGRAVPTERTGFTYSELQ
jgi:hypothetical protein